MHILLNIYITLQNTTVKFLKHFDKDLKFASIYPRSIDRINEIHRILCESWLGMGQWASLDCTQNLAPNSVNWAEKVSRLSRWANEGRGITPRHH